MMKRLFEEVNGELVSLDHLCLRCADFLMDFELGETNICLMCEAELEAETLGM